MRVRYIIALGASSLVQSPASAQQSPVAAYIQQAFGALPQTNCSGGLGSNHCTVPVVVVANSIHTPGSSSFNSPASGSVRYCSASVTYLGAPIFGFSAFGEQRRSETSPPFADEGVSCQLDFNLNYTTMKFIGPKNGNVVPTLVYNLQILNGMLIGTTSGFTAVVVFGTPSAVPVRRP